MPLFPSHMILHGRSTKVGTLIQNREHTAGWEREWLNVLDEWYSSGRSITVQTSGSTGRPKTISLSKEFVGASAVRTLRYFGLNPGDRVLHCLPSRYIAGKLMVVRCLVGSLDMHAVDPSTSFDFLEQEHYRFAAMVPNQVSKILDKENGISQLGHIDKLLIGGSSIPRSLKERLQELSTEIYSSYAMTETATHVAICRINGPEADDLYHCMEGIRVSLSAEGCLRLFVPGLNATPELNAVPELNTTPGLDATPDPEAREQNSWLQTTDLAELKDEKTFRVLGRADHVIISGGVKFSPERLEQKLEKVITQPFMISSLPHDQLGEQIILLIEGEEDRESIAALKEICRQRLDKYEQPRQIRFIPRLPRTPNGKLDRKRS